MLDVPPVRYADAGGTHIAYQVVGDGPIDLLVAPGFISHLDLQWTMPTFASYVELLAAFSRVILFDKRGTGLSDPSPDAARFEQRVDDIDAVLEAAGSRSAVVLGMSEGGPLAVLYAATRPERVDSLVLLGTFAAGRSIDPGVIERFDAAVDRWGEGLTSEIFLSPASRRVLAKSYFGLFERASCSPGMARALLDSIKEVDVAGILPSLDLPTLVLHRRHDPFAASAWSDELESLLPGARRVELDGEDHLPWLGDPAPIAGAVCEFTTGRASGRVSSRMLATLMFTDIVDSTRRAVELGDDQWKHLLARHNEVSRAAIAEHRGREVKALGDGFLGMFSTPGAAVRCARAIETGLAPLGLDVRAGIHTGEVDLVDIRDVAGVNVHIAARVGARAGPGEVLVTSAVKDLLVGEALEFRRRGPHQLKGLPGPVDLYALEGERPVPDVADRRIARPGDRITMGALRSMARMRRWAVDRRAPVPSG